ncbi:hypothetical protein ACOSP7_028176 [Xanthoceras sorbifolium]
MGTSRVVYLLLENWLLLLRGGRSCPIFLGSLLPSSSPCSTKRLGQFRVFRLSSQWSLPIGSLWAVIVIFWAVFELLVLAPIRPSDRRLRSAGRDRVFPSSSFSDPLSVQEIGEAMKVEAEVMQRQFIVWAVFC